MSPKQLNKYLYIEETPTWKVRSMYAFGLASWLLVVLGFSSAMFIDPFFKWFVTPIVFFFTIYHLSSYGLNLFYRQFDLKKHLHLVQTYWQETIEPTVDIFLPICGEDIDVLRHTWAHVARLSYANKKVYILDDSKVDCDKHKQLAKEFGFTHLDRPNKGEMKKAGNLKYAYERTNGEFIVIFDADFAPHPDFLKETLPHMRNEKNAIIQTPQYFETTKDMHSRSPLAYGAGCSEEPFYRFIQVVRDRFGGTVCCGSNAVYRRSALNSIGGFVQIADSEDAHTGFALSGKGWNVKYVPVILALGLCPTDGHAYFHQQHRWCTGSVNLVISRKFWTSPTSWGARLCHITGFLFYAHHPLMVLFSFQLFWTLFFYNQGISATNGILFYPQIIFAAVYLAVFPIARLRWGYFYVLIAQTYSYSHAVLSSLLDTTVGWTPTNAKQTDISPAFRQTTMAVATHVFAYLVLMALAARTGMLHLFDYNYYPVQFWMFYNLILSSALLLMLYRTMENTWWAQIENGAITRVIFCVRQLQTAGVYTLLATGVFLAIVYL